MLDAILMELQQEAEATRGLLRAVPVDKFSWKPHDKSMSAGELSMHIATNAPSVCEIFNKDQIDMNEINIDLTPCATTDEIVATFDTGIKKAEEICRSWSPEQIGGEWKITNGEQVLMAAPRIGALRMFMLSHLYHHRGQLSVYLRLLDIPVPSVYGPTADVNPFG